MPDYKTGTYIIKSKKVWQCNYCNKEIKIDEQVFARIKEYGEEKTRSDGKKYKLKNYTRFHIDCARKRKDLNEHESALLFNIGGNGLSAPLNVPLGIDISSLETILEALKIYGFKAVYKESDTILLRKTGVALDTP